MVARDQLKSTLRREKSERILSLLAENPVIMTAKHLFIYVHFRSEVETMELIEWFILTGKKISVPVTLLKDSSLLAVRLTDPASQLKPGCFGILEPTKERITQATVDPVTIDTVLVPGSVFDPTGGRLGYGGGFYDRFLSSAAPQAVRIGLAYEVQMVEEVPMEAHDQYMDMIVTEKKIYDCAKLQEEKRGRDAKNSDIPG